VLIRFVMCNALEWYNFMVVLLLGPLLQERFMPPVPLHPHKPPRPWLQLGLFFMVAALGLLGLPFSPGLFYRIKGKLGCGRAGGWAAYLTVVPPLVMACMPVYALAWASSIPLLALLLLLQSLALGRDFGSSAVILAGNGARSEEDGAAAAAGAAAILPGAALQRAAAAVATGRGSRGSWVLMPLALGALGAAGSCCVTAYMLPPDVFMSWGWRVPLALALPGCLLGMILRGLVSDPEEGMSEAELSERYDACNGSSGGGLGAVRGAKAAALLGLLLGGAGAATFTLAVWLLPSYFVQLGSITYRTSTIISAANMLLLVLALPFGGWVADKTGSRRKCMLATTALLLVTAYPVWLLLSFGHPAPAWFAQLVLVLLLGLFWGPLPSVLVDLFPEGRQVGGVAAVHHSALWLFGGCGPAVAVALMARGERKAGGADGLAAPAAAQAVGALCSGLGLMMLKVATSGLVE
jgi:MHS family proline/betaine transporter-like MFS transporter